VLEFLELDTIVPYLICVKAPTSADAKKLLKGIRNAYSELIQSMPLEKLPDDVEFNDEFEMESWIDG